MIGARTALELVAVTGALAALGAALAIFLVRRSRTREVAAAQRGALLAGAGELLDRAGAAVDQARLSGALERTEAELRAVLSALAEAVTVQRADGKVIYANRAAAEMLGAADERELLEYGAAQAWSTWDIRDERGEEIAP